jgi:hypothetical protein
MPAFKPPTFQERVALAAKAKQAALNLLREKAPKGEAEISARQAAREARAAAESEKRRAVRDAREREKADRLARSIERRELEAIIPELTEEDQRLARTVRYSPRKRRSR